MLLLIHLTFLLLHSLLLLPHAHAAANSGDFSEGLGPRVQKYAVSELPLVSYELPASWAGQIRVPGKKDDELFFWLFEAESDSSDLIIWLQGGPGCSDMGGLVKENGPLSFPGNSSTPKPNPYSWTKLANVLYIDQPVGTGFSSGSDPANDNAEITGDLYNWLKAFYAEFPGLQAKNTYLMGESYAGVYLITNARSHPAKWTKTLQIPYLTKAILADHETLPVNLKSITIGDGSFGNYAAQTDVAINAYLHEQKKLLQVPQEILNAFAQADRQCGFDKVLRQITYPPRGRINIPGNPEQNNFKRQEDCFPRNPNTAALINESVNTLCYGGCATWSTASNYLNYTKPCFSVYNINYTCSTTPPQDKFVAYFNQPSVQKAIHAPRKIFQSCNSSLLGYLTEEYVTPPAYSIMPAILENGIPIHLYSGGYDLLLNHIGTELAIQNMTWCKKQGLQRRPKRKFRVHGKVVGNWGSERGLSYHHIRHAGHAVPADQPAIAFAYVRDFVLGRHARPQSWR